MFEELRISLTEVSPTLTTMINHQYNWLCTSFDFLKYEKLDHICHREQVASDDLLSISSSGEDSGVKFQNREEEVELSVKKQPK